MTKDITLVIVDTASHKLAKFSIEKTLENINCKEVLIFSDQHIIDGAKHVPIKADISLYDYSEIILKQLWPFIETQHVLVTQWDGMAANSAAWSDDFLKYDYIGAIWPWAQNGIHMGNGGFSLRSLKLIDACRDTKIKLGGFSGQNEDIAICVEYRTLLQDNYNIQYAPNDVARKFAIENECGSKLTFGFHGPWNIPRFFPEQDIKYFAEHLPIRFWKDSSKVQSLINVLVDQKYMNIAHEILIKFKEQQ